MSWKLSVSTLGMPGRPVVESVRTALDHGCDGVELRVHPDEEVTLGMGDGAARDAARHVTDAGLEISCLAGYVRVCGGTEEDDDAVIEELRALIRLAEVMGAPSVRVFPGGTHAGRQAAHRRIEAVLEDLTSTGVQLLVETHDSHPTAEDVLELLAPFGEDPRVGVLWDILHPFINGEEPSTTASLLGGRVHYVQVKDASMAQDWKPAVTGEGDLPLEEIGGLLAGGSGWISLEWERAWYPDIPEISVPLAATAQWFEKTLR
ncbi:sugar phosphate isomerase/epimerase family protein [Nesterenkonia sp. HG001]|uniref:sugar phosphate isomerase/epimerase family protein n=1 Tax=Nesterenkonia sp. HG001 TaxID=2983207 RepID=UPI002AC67D90|nr:sugar phosphate isomerase/epimerase family protein [Nesterenkonia sp. HG001]MDZ5077222.1 sugar phosphate isomerase/epimerase [Nesterenkonia sp. HG001]